MDASSDTRYDPSSRRSEPPGGGDDTPPPDDGPIGSVPPELAAWWLALEADRTRLRAELAERTRERDESSARFHALVETNADGIVVVDGGGIIRYANPRAAELFGIPIVRLLGTPFGHPLSGGASAEIDLLPASREPVTVEMRVVCTDWNGQPASLASLRDITDRRRAEEAARELIRAEAANRAKTDLIAVISHDLRTPLHSIIGYADLLEMGVGADLGTRGRDFVHRIRASAEHQVHLIDQLLTFSRLETGHVDLRPQEVDLAVLLDEVRSIVEPIAEQAGLALRVSEHPPIVLETDPDAVRQVVLNLATNAVKYTERGEVRLEAAPAEDGASIRISDTGIGIAPEHLDRIFDPFWQADPGRRRGTGLGLSIVRRLAGALGGRIEVASRPGHGTTFALRLPATPPEPSGTLDGA